MRSQRASKSHAQPPLKIKPARSNLTRVVCRSTNCSGRPRPNAKPCAIGAKSGAFHGPFGLPGTLPSDTFLAAGFEKCWLVMEMHQVRYFLAVTEELNFSRAARSCEVSQPTLSRAIKSLEAELGGDLFRREGA